MCDLNDDPLLDQNSKQYRRTSRALWLLLAGWGIAAVLLLFPLIVKHLPPSLLRYLQVLFR